MTENNDTWAGLFKAVVAWIGVLVGSITLSKLVLFATLVYTVLQTYVLWRDKLKGQENGKL
ncbi:hypothetical protein [Ralstonia chuxiongensis]|uniref:Uncharacterized protein n=1 Tax=Ralstonia chuxiongensis TaxID=2957504 RepID=A0AA42BJ81_9RALS|nr:hypothetical protein [Ralstonia chuxiongensis]MCP1173803.1 hypothetical protein [Ralstonia chuxiongensis]